MTGNDTKLFWSLIAMLDWGKDCDYKRVKRTILKTLDKDTADALRACFSQRMNALEHVAGEYISGVGDDSWGDVRAHIIGLGQEVYDAAIEDWNTIQDRIDSNDYVESFSYGLPHTDDWTFDEDAPKRADRYIEDLAAIEYKIQLTSAEQWMVDDMRRRLNLIKEGNMVEALEGWKREHYTAWGKLVHKADNMDKVHYGAPNLISDLEEHV